MARKMNVNEKWAVAVGVVVVSFLFIVPVFFGSFLSFSTVSSQDVPAAAGSATGQATQTDLVIEDRVLGEGEAAKVGSRVSVHYIGILSDGTPFDSSLSRNEPFVFTLGRGEVIAGWDQGVVGMREGGTRILVIPSHLAYGARAVGTIPPYSTLIFQVQLLDVQ